MRGDPRETLTTGRCHVPLTAWKESMRFELNEEQQFLVDTTQRFLAKELPSTALRAWTRNAAGDAYRQWWHTCAALGWAGIFAPASNEDYGSVSGSPVVDAAIVSELAGAALAPSALLGSSVAVRAIASAAPDDTATLDGLLDGARIATLRARRSLGDVESRHGRDRRAA